MKHRPLVSWLVATATTAMLLAGCGGGGSVSAPAKSSGASVDTASAATTARPTVVIVHGAFADASGWNDVIGRLRRAGYPVIAPANPLRGVGADAAYIHSMLATDEGESQMDIFARFPGSHLGPTTIITRPFPGGVDQYIDLKSCRDVFAADQPPSVAATMAATQRPRAQAATTEKSGPAAWRTLPSWYMVAKHDHAIPPAAERFMAKRAHAHTVEVKSSHDVMVSHPAAVTKLILDAAQSASQDQRSDRRR